jgi:hypothetical protein
MGPPHHPEVATMMENAARGKGRVAKKPTHRRL